MSKVEEIETAIGKLAPQEVEELLLWLEQHYTALQPIDLRIQSDANAGCLDNLLQEAADDYRNGRTRPL